MSVYNDTSVKFTSEAAVKSCRGFEPIKRITKRISVRRGDFSDGDTSQTYSVGTLSANSILFGITTMLRQDFAGGTVSAAVIDVGTAANPDLYVDALDVFTGAANTFRRESVADFGDATAGVLPLAIAAAETIQLVLTTTGGNINTLTAGDVEVTFYVFDPTDPDA